MNQLVLPGISPEYLGKAEVCQVDAAAARRRCGIGLPGIIFPYRNFYGDPIEEGENEFARLRLDPARGDQKYHQRSGTRPHAYLPPSIWGEDKNLNNPIIVVEGEKKALAAAEEGYTAIGIGGFFNFRDRESEGALVQEIADVMENVKTPMVIFLGDRDVVFNPQFSHAAFDFAQLVGPAPVMALCLPLDAPGKGLDDCRNTLNTGFKPWFNKLFPLGAGIGKGSTPGSIALALLRPQISSLSKLQGNKRDEAVKGLSKLAAGLRAFPLEQAGIIDIAVEELKIGRSVFKRAMNEERQKLLADLSVMDLDVDPSKIVDLGEQPGTWTRRVLEIIGPSTYVYGGNLCEQDFETGKFAIHTTASLVPFIDSPDCCRFVYANAKGEMNPTNLAESHSRLVLGALRQHADVLQPVEILSQVPVLMWSSGSPEVITGYSRVHKVLAADGKIELPEPTEAAAELLGLIHDFDLASPGDAGRAIAFLLTPALVRGRFLDSGRSPFFMIEKDQKGAGAGTFAQMLAAIYGAKPCSITPDDPKSAKEDISMHLLEGANFIYYDNIRGKVLTMLPFFESFITEPLFTCRAPYLHGAVDVSRCVVACTSNGAVLSPDLADRTVKIAIRKQPDGYSYHSWPEGHLIDHVVATRPRYLACIYSLIQAWALENRPAGIHLTGFRFPQWERACAWIVERFFSPLPLLDADHKVSQQRMANTDFDLLRAIFRAALDQELTNPVTVTDLARIARQANRIHSDDRAALLRIGRILSKEFPKEGIFQFADEFQVRRRDVSFGKDSNWEKMKTYSITPSPGKKLPSMVSVPTRPTADISACPPPPPSAVPVEP